MHILYKVIFLYNTRVFVCNHFLNTITVMARARDINRCYSLLCKDQLGWQGEGKLSSVLLLLLFIIILIILFFLDIYTLEIKTFTAVSDMWKFIFTSLHLYRLMLMHCISMLYICDDFSGNIPFRSLGLVRFFNVFEKKKKKKSAHQGCINLIKIVLFSVWIHCNVIYGCDAKHHFSSLQCHMIFRNHSNMMICCSRNISSSFSSWCWKLLCCFIFLWKPRDIFSGFFDK